MKEVACKKCKTIFFESDGKCPRCGEKDYAKDWKGMIIILSPELSEIAKKKNLKEKGKYAIKI